MHAKVYTLTMRYREASQMQPLLNPTQSKQQVLRSFRNDPWRDHRPPMSTDKEIQHPVVHKALAMQYTPYVHTTVSIMVWEKSKAPRCSVRANLLEPSSALMWPCCSWRSGSHLTCPRSSRLQDTSTSSGAVLSKTQWKAIRRCAWVLWTKQERAWIMLVIRSQGARESGTAEHFTVRLRKRSSFSH